MEEMYTIGLQAGKNVAEIIDMFIKTENKNQFNNFNPEKQKTLRNGTTVYKWYMKWNPMKFDDEQRFMEILRSFPNDSNIDLEDIPEEEYSDYVKDAWKLVLLSDNGNEDMDGNHVGLNAFRGLHRTQNVSFPLGWEDKPEKPIYTHDEAGAIIELFENLLIKNDIILPSPEDSEREEGNEAAIYGTVYGDLLQAVEDRLIEITKKASRGAKIIPDIYSGTC